jgi:hypothetical protein
VDKKGHQVALMKDIYAYSNEVIVWLGPDDERIATDLFEVIRKLLVLVEEAIEQNYEELDTVQ